MTTLAQFNALVQLLGHAHRFLRFEEKPDRGILLQCTGGIGQIWLTTLLFLLHFEDGVCCPL